MISASAYAAGLYKVAGEEDYQQIVELLHALNMFVEQRGNRLQNMTEETIEKLFSELPKQLFYLKNFVLLLHRNNDLKILPQVYKSFVRILERDRYSIVQITTASALDQNEQFAKQFGERTIILRNTNPALMAGMQVTTSIGTYEYSLELQLARLHETLRMSDEATKGHNE